MQPEAPSVPAQAQKPARTPRFSPRTPAPLRYSDFRVLLASTVLGGIGFRGQLVAVGWILLEQSDSPFIVSLGIGAFLAPNAVMGVLGGAIADRIDRRLLIRLASFVLTLTTLVLGLLTLDRVVIWQVLVLSMVGGALWSLIQTARQSYAYDVVGAEDAVGGLALITLALRLGGVAGSLGTGLFLGLWGAGEAYLALSVSLLLSSIVILFARSRGQAAPASNQPVWQNIREYLAELRSNRTLTLLVLLTASVEVFGFSHLSALPVLIRDQLGGDGGDLGLTSAFSSAGGIIAIVLFTARNNPERKGLTFLGVLVVFGLTIVLLGHSQTLVMAILAASLVSGLASLSDVLSQSLVQLAVPNEMRGRAMGSWSLAIGIAPLGQLQIGALISTVGLPAALTINGVALVLVAIFAGIAVGRLRGL